MNSVALKRISQGGGLFTDGDWIESPYITEEGVRLIQTGNIGVGVYKEQGNRYVSEETFHALNCTAVLPGDLLICRLADPVGRACIAPDLGVPMITSVDVAILRSRPGAADPRFLNYWFSSSPHLALIDSLARGGTRSRVSREQLSTVPVPLMALNRQSAIADYLDAETARIDALIVKKRRMIELLEERMIGQRAEWFGALSSRWGLLSLRRIARKIEQGWSPVCDSTAAEPDEWGVLKTSAVSSGAFRPDENKRLPLDTPPDTRWAVEDGDLLITRGSGSMSMVAAAAVARPGGRRLTISDLIYRVQLVAGASPDFVAECLWSSQARAQIESSIRSDAGQTLKVRGDDLRDIRIPAVPLGRQRSAVESAISFRTIHGEAREHLRAQMDLLAEKRQALITAAVTGELSLPGVAA